MTTNSWNIFIGTPDDFEDKAQVTEQCLEIANKANFPTDYKDMYEHLFGNENAELYMVLNESGKIYGFATCDNIPESSNTYIHGIIIHPEIQGIGFGLMLIDEILKKNGNQFLTARTHNPRVYAMMSSVAYNGDANMVFPNINSCNIPEEIWSVVASHPDMENADEDMIVRNAYPDEKVSQKVRDENIYNIFKKLSANDAQVVVVCTKKPFWL